MPTTSEQTTDPMRDGKPHVDAHRALRWSVTRAAKEFHVDFKTLTKRLTAAGISPGHDGRYSTLEICRALFLDGGDIDAEKLRKVRLECDLLQRKLDEADGRLLDADAVLRCWSQAVLNVRGAVLALPIPEANRHAILDAICEVPKRDYSAKPDRAELELPGETDQALARGRVQETLGCDIRNRR